MRGYYVTISLLFSTSLLFVNCGCDEGDFLGPVERTARAVFNGWDMWATESVRPYEMPMPRAPDGAIRRERKLTFEETETNFLRLGDDEKKSLGELSYRRYCYHCHGENGDGRIIVGESFGVAMTDLRLNKTQSQTDKELFEKAFKGTGNMLSLEDTMTPIEAISTIYHLRGLKNAPSKPYFTPKSVEPIK
ncbi:MAG: hypothetical protein Kow0090_13650 [Myxococcota bacterium]